MNIDQSPNDLYVKILEKIVSVLDLEQVLKRIVETAVEITDADEGSLLLVDHETGELYMRAARGFGEEYARSFRQKVTNDNIAGRVVITRRPVLITPESELKKKVKVKTGFFARSVLNLPILRNNVTHGVLGVYNSGSHKVFEHRHLLLLQPLADYAAIAIENARRYQEIQQLLGDVNTLFEIVGRLNETRDVDELFQLVASQALGRIKPADRVVIHLLNPETKRLERKARIPLASKASLGGRGFAVGEGIAGRVLQANSPISVANIEQEPSFVSRDIDHGALMVAPISGRSVCIGTISVASPKPNAFIHQHQKFLVSLANLANIAIENTKILEAEKSRAAQLKIVAELGEKLTSILDLDELLKQSANLIHKTFGFEDVAIALLNEEDDTLEYRVIAGLHANVKPTKVLRVGEGLMGWAAKTGRVARTSDVTSDTRYVVSRLRHTKSELDIPLRHGGEVIGVLNIQSRVANNFTPHDELALEALAALIAVAIQNARLYDRQLQLNEESQERLQIVEQRNNELRSLRDVLGALQSTLSLSGVLARIVNGVVEGLNYKAVMLSTVDDDKNLLIVKEFALQPELALQGLLEKGEKIAGQKVVGNTASLIDHTENIGIQVCLDRKARVTKSLHDIFRPIVGKKISWVLQNMLKLNAFAVLPIKSESQLFGVLYASTESEEISEADLESLQTFADQAALAIQNAGQYENMHERLRRRVRELQGLQNIDRLISSTADLEKMLRSILDIGLKLVGAESGNIVMTDKKTGRLVPKVSYPKGSISLEKYEPGLTGWVARERETRRISDLSQSPWANTYKNFVVLSELAAPIILGDKLVGVINIGSPRLDAFDQEDESLLDILATQTAVAIQSARYYQELTESRLRSAEAERIAAMSDIAGNMVHSINNSTGAIRVLVQQIRRKMTKDTLPQEELLTILDRIEMSAEKTLEMARSIRNPFQHQPTELVDVNFCIQNVIQEFEPFPSTINLRLELSDTLPLVPVNRQLEEVFRNLFNNAIEAMEGEGTLHVASKRLEDRVEVAVTDSGPGIPSNLSQTSIFTLGISSKPSGLGYGLWWCKIYLNRVGGAIQLDANFKFGCRFVITLPLKPKFRTLKTE